ncbi:hypothetical protein RRG08_056109 [Elysia crispata]|uniref:Kinesin motor domain-containing protein n=1 Tax=Elysia crispata TaxID=231223 RepID=A0AAE0ZC39_9GAST|nr:hypothetical protein RRG08_056109 [Elysia crispata]
MSDKVQVAVRVRPVNKRERDLGTKCVVDMENNQTILLPLKDSVHQDYFLVTLLQVLISPELPGLTGVLLEVEGCGSLLVESLLTLTASSRASPHKLFLQQVECRSRLANEPLVCPTVHCPESVEGTTAQNCARNELRC